jgi:hypothetical protein
VNLVRLAGLLEELADLLTRFEEGATARGLRRLAIEATSASSDVDQRAVVLRVVALYSGMGSMQDLVLQNSIGVRPEQVELDALRSELFDEARRRLR